MKRASYRQAIEWIALNDEPSIMSEQFIADLISVQIIAEIFDVNPYTVANAVIKFREKHQ